MPRVKLLRQLANVLLLGKLSHAVAKAMAPWQPGSTTPSHHLHQLVQVGINNVAQTTSGHRRWDRVKTEELLQRAGFPSLNSIVTNAVVMEAWKTFHSSNSDGGCSYPISQIIFGQPVATGACPFRSWSATAGQVKVKVPLREVDTMVRHAAKVWNACRDLRLVETWSQAERVAAKFAARCPL
jgi:hypothetical protein